MEFINWFRKPNESNKWKYNKTVLEKYSMCMKNNEICIKRDTMDEMCIITDKNMKIIIKELYTTKR